MCPAGVNAHPAAGHMGPALQGDFLALRRGGRLCPPVGDGVPYVPQLRPRRKATPSGWLFLSVYSSKGTPNICQNCRFSLSDTMAEFHEPNVKLAQLSVPFSTDTVRPSSNVTVSLAPNPQEDAPP